MSLTSFLALREQLLGRSQLIYMNAEDFKALRAHIIN